MSQKIEITRIEKSKINDIDFNNFNLIVDGLDLKPGRPFKLFIKQNRIYLFFPGNPCSSFVLTNIIIKSLIEIYNFNKSTFFIILFKHCSNLFNINIVSRFKIY